MRVQNESNFGGKGWEMESSITLNQQLITNTILSGGVYYGRGGYGGGAPPANAGDDYLAVPADDAGTGGQSAEEVRTADVTALFVGMTGPNVRVTRMRSDISHSAMTTDFVLKASDDQSEITNVRNVTRAVNLQCPIYNECNVVGYGTPEQAAASVNGSSGDGGGCRTANRSLTAQDIGITLASILGLALVRVRRRAKDASKDEQR
jgi:hypothetical protein